MSENDTDGHTRAAVSAAANSAAERVLSRVLEDEAAAVLKRYMSGKAGVLDVPEGSGDLETWGGLLRELVTASVNAALVKTVTPPPAPEPEAEPIKPLCPDVQTWVEHVYVPTFTRALSQSQRWCPQWWLHPEAIVRLTALWQTWEAARINDSPHAMADWLRLYLDGINPVLLADDGPFMSCGEKEHNDARLYQLVDPPADYWRDLSA